MNKTKLPYQKLAPQTKKQYNINQRSKQKLNNLLNTKPEKKTGAVKCIQCGGKHLTGNGPVCVAPTKQKAAKGNTQEALQNLDATQIVTSKKAAKENTQKVLQDLGATQIVGGKKAANEENTQGAPKQLQPEHESMAFESFVDYDPIKAAAARAQLKKKAAAAVADKQPQPQPGLLRELNKPELSPSDKEKKRLLKK